MLSLYTLKEHCRTCLVKLETLNFDEDLRKFISINIYPDIEHLMLVCLGQLQNSIANEIEDNNVYNLMPHLCRLCFEKWQDFVNHYKLAKDSDRKLRHILERGVSDEDEDSQKQEESGPNEIFIDTIKHKDLNEIEKHDTIAPFYQTSHSNSPTGDIQKNQNNNNALDCMSQDESNSNTPDLFQESINSSDDDIPIQELKKVALKSKQICPSYRLKTSKTKRKRGKVKTHKALETNPPKPLKHPTKKAHFRCEPCKKYFYEIRKYEAHVKQVHEGAKKPFQCKLCDKAYKFHKTLVDHIALNHSDKPLETYKCDMCNNIFKTQITLKTHIQNKHPESDAESQRVICDQCGFLAVNQISLRKHIKNRHTAGEALKCDECPKVFKNQYYLKYHKMNFHNHLNIKPFKCDECEMTFTRLALLNTHKRSHLDVTQRIKCDFEGCDVRFLQQAEKRRHMRLVHLKVKQYVCDICGAAFGTKPTLRHHRYIHTNEKPYKCSVCGQGFRQRSAMKTHSKIHTGKTKTKEEKKSKKCEEAAVRGNNTNTENIVN